MNIKKLLCTFIILFTSSSAFASLIRVDFSAEFATPPLTTTLGGWFQYDDTTKLLTDISLEILGVVHNTSTVDFDLDYYGPNKFLLFGSVGGDGVSPSNLGDFFLFDYPSAGQRVFLFADGSSNNRSTSVSLASSTVQVPVPSTIGIFALGLIGLAARRFKKQS